MFGKLKNLYSYFFIKNKILKISIIILLIIIFSLFCYLKISKEFNFIHIAMALNNNYTYPIMVSITSILLNKKNITFINFHLLIDNYVTKKNIKKISSLKKINGQSKFFFHNVKNNFTNFIIKRKRLTVATFYRSILGEIIENVDKIIYLDGDTLTFGDLTEMYKLDMTDLYFRGIREIKHPSRYTNESRYICAGVMLINLGLIRKNRVFEKFRNYYYFYANKRLYINDQDIINGLFTDKIGFLPPKYGIFYIKNHTLNKYKKMKPPVYNISELILANKEPIIRHLWGKLPRKPWLFEGYDEIKTIWNYYANKTGYYTSICKFFKNACINIYKN